MVLFRQVDDTLPDMKILQRYYYSPFGHEISEGPWHIHDADFGNPYRNEYNGKENITGSQLLNYGARHYDPIIGRWLGVDPLAEKYYGFSGYNYVMGNPIKLTDPTGMEPEIDLDDPPIPSVAGIIYESYLNADAAIYNFMNKGIEALGYGKPGINKRKETQYDEYGGVYGNEIVEKPEGSWGDAIKETAADLLSLSVFSPMKTSLVLAVKTPGPKNAIITFIKGSKEAAIKVVAEIPKGFKETNLISNKQRVYSDGKRWISPDQSSHVGGVWKMFDKEKNVGSTLKKDRLGTYDANLKRIGD